MLRVIVMSFVMWLFHNNFKERFLSETTKVMKKEDLNRSNSSKCSCVVMISMEKNVDNRVEDTKKVCNCIF